MDIGWAVTAMLDGRTVQRACYRERGFTVWLQQPGAGGPLDWPLFVSGSPQGRIAWVATHGDLLADDWEMA